MNGRLVLCQLGFKVCLVAVDILSLEVDRRGDVEIVEEVSNMEQDGMRGLAEVSNSTDKQ